MLLRLFRSNRPMVMVFLLLGMVLLWLIPWRKEYHFSDALLNGGILDQLIVLPSNSVLLIGGFVAVFLQAILINSISNKAAFYAKETYLPGVIYTVGICYDPRAYFLSSEHIFFLVFLLAIRLLISIYRDQSAIETTYLFGLLIAIASLVHLPGLFALPVAWMFLVIIRPFQWREYLAPLLGILTVSAFTLSWYFVFSTKPSLDTFLRKSDAFLLWQSEFEELTFTIYSLAGIFILLGLVRWFAEIQKSTMRYKKLTRSFMLSILVMIIVNGWVYSNRYPHYMVSVLSLLLAFLSTFYFYETRWNNIKVIGFHLFLALIVVNHLL